MDRCRRFSFVLATAVCALAIAFGTAQGATAVSKADIDNALAGVAAYTTGQARVPLLAIEQALRDTAGNAEMRRHIERGLVALLEGGAGHDAKLFACQQLWAIGSDASVPVLTKMLVDDTASHMACYALARHPSPSVAPALRRALATAKGKALLGVIDLLGERRDGVSVGALGKLAAGGDAAVAKAAVVALGKIGSEGAAEVLDGLRNKGGALRAEVAHASLQCAQRLVVAHSTRRAADLYRKLFAA